MMMTTAQVVETSITTKNSLPRDYPHLDDHAKNIIAIMIVEFIIIVIIIIIIIIINLARFTRAFLT